MTDRILDVEGKYAPQVPIPAVSEPIDPTTLPQIKPDKYRNVDPSDFSTAIDMSRGQMMTLADISASRNEPELSMRWKQLATEKVRHDQAQETNELAERLAQNTYAGEPGPGIVNPVVQTPWHQDSEYQLLAHQHQAKAAEIAEMDSTDPEYFDRTGELSALADAMVERESVVREQTPSWTQADDNAFAANQSLIEKSAEIANLMYGATE